MATNSELKRVADNIRVLSAAMVEKAKSGHPGGSMGGADFMAVLPDVEGDIADDSLFKAHSVEHMLHTSAILRPLRNSRANDFFCGIVRLVVLRVFRAVEICPDVADAPPVAFLNAPHAQPFGFDQHFIHLISHIKAKRPGEYSPGV